MSWPLTELRGNRSACPSVNYCWLVALSDYWWTVSKSLVPLRKNRRVLIKAAEVQTG